MKKILITAIAVFLISGCSARYSCGQFPESGCQPVSTVYNKTNEGYHDYRKNLYSKKRTSGKYRYKDDEDRLVRIGRAHKAINYKSPGDPILTKPVIMRILVSSWVDKQKDLNTGGFVYIKLRDSKWVIK